MMYRRIFCFLLALWMLLCGSALGEEFSYENAEDAKLHALECLKACAFSAEYGNNGRNQLVRWEEPILIWVEGSPGKDDLKMLDRMMTELNLRVPLLPNIRYAPSRRQANAFIWFGPLSEMDQHVSGYTEGNWGYFTFRYENWVIYRMEIAIATDVTNQRQRNHLIQEEFIGALGLANDHTLYSDSILYQPWTETQAPSEVDFLMLNMLYHPAVSPGMNRTAACKILEGRILAD